MDVKAVKDQRDRFLAFALASSDLFLEIGDKGAVAFVFGAPKSVTGVDEKTLAGRPWLELFSNKDQARLEQLIQQARPGVRCGPLQVTLDGALGGGRTAIMTGIKMPDTTSFYITVGFLTPLMERLARILHEQEDFNLLNKDEFIRNANDTLSTARSIGQNVDMTLLEIADSKAVKKRMGQENWEGFTMALTRILSESAADGQAAGQIAEGRYSVIHDKSITADAIRSQIASLTQQTDPEGKGFDISTKTVSADLRTLNEREASKALIYTLNEFERKGNGLTIDNLNNSFKAYVTANAHKIQMFKSMIETLSFELHFQPIVDMRNLECAHYEMLSRFRGEGSPQEWVIFGEDIGMAAELDIAVCERALNYLQYKSQGRRTRFAINLSGQSIQSEAFFKSLMTKLGQYKGASERLMFEITESTAIQDLELVRRHIQILQSENFKVCMDDFGAGAASFQYLQSLPVNYVKIDGQYTRKIVTSERDRVMVLNLARMCHDLGIAVVAEQIEEQQQADMMLDMGITLGQGYLFARPMPKPEYTPHKS